MQSELWPLRTSNANKAVLLTYLDVKQTLKYMWGRSIIVIDENRKRYWGPYTNSLLLAQV